MDNELEDYIPKTITCVLCHKEIDERDTLTCMGVSYCPKCVVYFIRGRLSKEDIRTAVDVLMLST